MFFLKVPFDHGAMGLGGAKVGTDVANQFCSVERSSPADRVRLDVLVEVLVRVELGAVPGQKIHPHDCPVFLEPSTGDFGNMHRVPIDNQEDLLTLPIGRRKKRKSGGSPAHVGGDSGRRLSRNLENSWAVAPTYHVSRGVCRVADYAHVTGVQNTAPLSR